MRRFNSNFRRYLVHADWGFEGIYGDIDDFQGSSLVVYFSRDRSLLCGPIPLETRRCRRQDSDVTCVLTLFRIRLHCSHTISLCEGGLHKFSGRPPVAGVENLEKEMKREFFDCDDPHITRIITSNYGRFETNLRTEWEFVVSPIKDKIYPGQEVCLLLRFFCSSVALPDLVQRRRATQS